jgi:hypothetical protein
MSLDRFDIVDLSNKGLAVGSMIRVIRRFAVLSWLAHVATEGTILVAVKNRD